MRYSLTLGLVLSIAATAAAELGPDEVAIIAMADSPESRELAKYYAKARGIPESNIFLLNGKPGRLIQRVTWRKSARPAIRKWLDEQGRKTKIRCMVTSWDVPLKIGKRDKKDPQFEARRKYLAETKESFMAQVAEVLRLLNGIAVAEPPARPELTPKTTLDDIIKEFNAALNGARQRLQTLTPWEDRRKAGAILERMFVAAGGNTAMLRLIMPQSESVKPTPKQTSQIILLQGRLQGLQRGLESLNSLPGSVARDDQVLSLLLATNGLFGAMRWIDQQENLLEKNESWSSFDSELSMLHWHDYPVLGWRPNPLHYSYDNTPLRRRPTLMVARLAAPTTDIVKRMIDDAIATEKTHLKGNVYLDARWSKGGSGKSGVGSFGQYDQSLRDLAGRLRKHTKLKVVLDEKKELFQPGSCPEAALYCGWYSLQKYVDAFQWSPGAVGYHLASSEAVWLRSNPNPRSDRKAWCPAMLEDGACATVGPVQEPYLVAFPLPDDFFSLLLTGRYSLAEVYYRTKPFNSWVMVLVGDPLYNPYKNQPLLGEGALPDHLQPGGAGAGRPSAASQPGKSTEGDARQPEGGGFELPGLEPE